MLWCKSVTIFPPSARCCMDISRNNNVVMGGVIRRTVLGVPSRILNAQRNKRAQCHPTKIERQQLKQADLKVEASPRVRVLQYCTRPTLQVTGVP